MLVHTSTYVSTIQEIQREENVGFEVAIRIQDAERRAGTLWATEFFKKHMTKNTTSTDAPHYSTHQVLEILVEARKNIVAGTTLLNYGSYDRAALVLEIAAEKLRVVQKEYDLSAGR